MLGFDRTEENELIATGAYFWCSGHLSVCPVTERSPDPRYCRGCYDFLKEEAKLLRSRVSAWVPRDGGTVQDATQPSPPQQDIVAKMPTKGIGLPHRFMQQKSKGRPIKTGAVHRATLWRRKKKEVTA